jgi:hypothetical protein
MAGAGNAGCAGSLSGRGACRECKQREVMLPGADRPPLMLSLRQYGLRAARAA